MALTLQSFASQAVAMLYPFYAVRAEVLLEMTTIEAHEDLKASASPYVPEVTYGLCKDPLQLHTTANIARGGLMSPFKEAL